MELQKNQVVKLRNGIFGAVASFNDVPFQLIFTAFTTPTRRYDENLKNKNENYDIVEIYDGSTLENVSDVFKKSFNADGLKLIWKRD
jgi:hypothetical protein